MLMIMDKDGTEIEGYYWKRLAICSKNDGFEQPDDCSKSSGRNVWNGRDEFAYI